MRPQRLHLEGFASFREPCDIDFADAELFVITGPTGSGKSSLIDAMVFALYGSIPRLENAKLLFPVITSGKAEARVQFEFAVGSEEYTAARVVRRTKTGGATTKEARLERRRKSGDVETLAGDADGVTAHVVKLIGLNFDQFKKCVALPQGAFADFLRAEKKERQNLLVALLDLDLYRKMAQEANALAKEHEADADYREQELSGELASATPELLKQAKKLVKDLEGLRKQIDATEPKLAELRTKVETAATGRDEAVKRANDLAKVKAPSDLTNIVKRGDQVGEQLRTAAEAKKAAEEHLYKERKALESHPDLAELKVLLQSHDQLGKATKQVGDLEKQLETAAKVAAADEAARKKAEGARRSADEALQAARTANAAAHLASGLEAGDTCPVCAQTIPKMPKHATPKELGTAEVEFTKAEKKLADVTQKRDASAGEESSLNGRLDGAKDDLSRIRARLKGKPSQDVLNKQVSDVEAARESVRTAEKAVEEAGKKARAAEGDKAKLDKTLKAAWKNLDTLRDTVASLAPPPVEDRDDLAGAWETLTAWAADLEPEERKRAEKLNETAEAEQKALDDALEELLEHCRELGIEASAKDYTTKAAAELATADAGVKEVSGLIEKAKKLRGEEKQLRAQAKVEKELGRLLGTAGFEAWLLQRALERLCVSASHRLRDLSSNQYSLQINEKREFEVIDHSNADEPRLARTLSGGETFMASLALALALAEDVAQLAAGGAERLDALFLDEGFGTLDPDTLDTVATAIEALGARGRVVGLITHVPELADRVPVRFQVTKDARTSSVERVMT